MNLNIINKYGFSYFSVFKPKIIFKLFKSLKNYEIKMSLEIDCLKIYSIFMKNNNK